MRGFFFITYLFLSLILLSYQPVTAQEHQRLIVTRGDATPLAFDPLMNRYTAGSLAALATFASDWRAELGEGNVLIIDLPTREQSLGYRIYHSLEDSTLRHRTMQTVGYITDARQKDSLLKCFGVTRGAVDSLSRDEWLVSDRYVVAGRAAVRTKRQDFSDIRTSEIYIKNHAEDEKRIRRFFLTPFTNLDTTITTRDGFFGPSAFADLFHLFQLNSAPSAEISLFAPPKLDATIPEGELCLNDVLSLFRFDNELVTVSMTGKELEVFLAKVFGMRFFTVNGVDSDMVRLKVPYYLHDDVAGLRFRVDLTKWGDRRVTIYETESGEKFDPKQNYTIVINSFRAKDLEKMGLKPVVVSADYRLALARWLTQQCGVLSPRARDNWSAAPERWVEAIAEREMKTIFAR